MLEATLPFSVLSSLQLCGGRQVGVSRVSDPDTIVSTNFNTKIEIKYSFRLNINV